jgi:hypothetical protein
MDMPVARMSGVSFEEEKEIGRRERRKGEELENIFLKFLIH